MDLHTEYAGYARAEMQRVMEVLLERLLVQRPADTHAFIVDFLKSYQRAQDSLRIRRDDMGEEAPMVVSLEDPNAKLQAKLDAAVSNLKIIKKIGRQEVARQKDQKDALTNEVQELEKQAMGLRGNPLTNSDGTLARLPTSQRPEATVSSSLLHKACSALSLSPKSEFIIRCQLFDDLVRRSKLIFLSGPSQCGKTSAVRCTASALREAGLALEVTETSVEGALMGMFGFASDDGTMYTRGTFTNLFDDVSTKAVENPTTEFWIHITDKCDAMLTNRFRDMLHGQDAWTLIDEEVIPFPPNMRVVIEVAAASALPRGEGVSSVQFPDAGTCLTPRTNTGLRAGTAPVTKQPVPSINPPPPSTAPSSTSARRSDSLWPHVEIARAQIESTIHHLNMELRPGFVDRVADLVTKTQRSNVVFVSGGAGCGKKTLVEVFARACTRANVSTVVSSASLPANTDEQAAMLSSSSSHQPEFAAGTPLADAVNAVRKSAEHPENRYVLLLAANSEKLCSALYHALGPPTAKGFKIAGEEAVLLPPSITVVVVVPSPKIATAGAPCVEFPATGTPVGSRPTTAPSPSQDDAWPLISEAAAIRYCDAHSLVPEQRQFAGTVAALCLALASHRLVFVCGPAASGKSTVVSTAANMVTEAWRSVLITKQHISCGLDEFFGQKTDSKWQDGVFTAALRKVCKDAVDHLNTQHWLVLDKNLPVRIANRLEEVLLAEDKVSWRLCLVTGEVIDVRANVRVVVEMGDSVDAPGTDNVGVVELDDDDDDDDSWSFAALSAATTALGLNASDDFVDRVSKLADYLRRLHCVFVTGPTACGKTALAKVLAQASTAKNDRTVELSIHKFEGSAAVVLGAIGLESGEWADGSLMQELRRLIKLATAEQSKDFWLVADHSLGISIAAPLANMLAEKKLRLSNNEELSIPNNLRVLVELLDSSDVPVPDNKRGVGVVSFPDSEDGE